MQELCYRCWDWAPHDLWSSALCLIVVFCDGLFLLQKEASVMRGDSTFEDLELGKTGERQHAAFLFLGLGYLT